MKKLIYLCAFLFLIAPSFVSASVALKQQSTGKNTGFASSVATAAFGSPLTNTSLILVCWEGDGVATWSTGNTPTDTAGNTYVLVTNTLSSGVFNSEMWYAENTHTTASDVITVGDKGGGIDSTVTAEEWTGLATSNPLDQVASTTGSSNRLSSGNITTTTADDMVFGCGAEATNGNHLFPQNYFAGFNQTSTTFTNIGSASAVLTQTMTLPATLQSTTTASWNMAVASFKISTTCGFGYPNAAGQCVGFLIASPGTGNATFNVPSDWNSTNNQVACIGSGGSGAAGAGNTSPGGGGGGGAYASTTNLSLTQGGTATYSIGASATTTTTSLAVAGVRETYFNGTASSTASLTCDWGRFSAGTAGTANQSIGATTTTGGIAGSILAGFSGAGSGGGGAAGPLGVGKAGGADNTKTGGNGGGGSDGGVSTAGSQSVVLTGANGGQGTSGAGQGIGTTTPSPSTLGGGGGGSNGITTGSSAGGAGSFDSIFDTWHGSGGGAGGSGAVNTTHNAGNGGQGGFYGGGGGAVGTQQTSGTGVGGAGGQGIIVIIYTPAGAVTPAVGLPVILFKFGVTILKRQIIFK